MFRTAESKLVSWDALPALAAKLHAQNKRIITTNGCFDLLHWGHIKYLSEARAMGDLLLCGLNSDASVRSLKGPTRPVVEEQIRALQLAGLEAIDYVVIFSQETPEKLLQLVRPAIHVKGGDYNPQELPERAVVEAGGGKVACVSMVAGFSTTTLLEKLKLLAEK